MGGEGRMMVRYRRGGDGSETGLVMKKKGEKIYDVSVPASLRTKEESNNSLNYVYITRLVSESFNEKSNMSRIHYDMLARLCKCVL